MSGEIRSRNRRTCHRPVARCAASRGDPAAPACPPHPQATDEETHPPLWVDGSLVLRSNPHGAREG